jgi:hypothetical protein
MAAFFICFRFCGAICENLGKVTAIQGQADPRIGGNFCQTFFR